VKNKNIVPWNSDNQTQETESSFDTRSEKQYKYKCHIKHINKYKAYFKNKYDKNKNKRRMLYK